MWENRKYQIKGTKVFKDLSEICKTVSGSLKPITGIPGKRKRKTKQKKCLKT